MRLHHLDIHAFGPFAGNEKVDFDALAGSGIFLLNGPTGAGKTSILDAICFALYGKVPGARGNRLGDIRSHLAQGDQLTRVVLEFSVRGRRLKVTREPSQTRPKKSGTGTTDHAATAVLQELSAGDWVPLASKSGDVTTMATDLMGLNAEQFQQVILLPQGEFAQFLRANSDDRQKLLQAVFDTSRFTSIETWLKDEAIRLGSDLKELEDSITAAFNECAGALEIEAPEANDVDRRQWLDSHAERLDGLLADATLSADEARTRVAAAAAEVAAVRTVADRQKRHREAVERSKEVADELAELPARKARLAAGRNALPVRTVLEQIDSLSPQLVTAAEACHDAELELTTVRPDLEGADIAHLETASEQLTRDLGKLDELATDERVALPAAQRRAAAAESAVGAVNAEVVRLSDAITNIDASLAGDLAVADDGTKAVELIQAATIVESELKQRVGQAKDRVGVQAQREEALADLAKANTEHQLAYEHRNAVFERRVASMSAELAAQLKDETPCPVCGSHDHPLPAKPTDSHATQSDLTSADEKVAEWANRTSGLIERIEGFDTRIQEINDAIGSESLDSVTARHNAALDTLSALESRREIGNEARLRLDEADSRRRELIGKLEAQRTTQPGHAAEDATARSELGRLRKSIDDGRDGYDSIAARIKALKSEVSAIGSVTASRNRHDEITRHLTNAGTKAIDTARQSGFDDLDQARAAILAKDALEALEESVSALEQTKTEIDTALGDPAVIEAMKLPPADVAVAAANDIAARDAEREANKLVHAVEQHTATLGRCRRTLDSAVTTGGPLRERYDVVRSLADLARGDKGGVSSGTRMRLSNYVLSARLAQVTTAASTRLRTMTDGRYTLLQTDDSGHGGRQGGLGIEVLDAFSGRTRSTQSLSGGESFAASLALALGLADVVAAEAGGISLDTLFIDEGFGTLDSESLNGVLDILDGLRSGGRTVGVVSHVADMKERIPTHVRVERTDRISHIVQ
jgi:exonuclease SbcC